MDNITFGDITLHYNLHFICNFALHYITHYIALEILALHYITHYIVMHYITLHITFIMTYIALRNNVYGHIMGYKQEYRYAWLAN